MTKLCPSCKRPTDASAASQSRSYYYCRACVRERGRKRYAADSARVRELRNQWRASRRELMRERSKQWANTPAGRAYRLAYKHTPHERPKELARKLAYSAIRNGSIVRQPCQQCGAVKAQMHHPDYSKPLDVIWLCPTCHGRVHRLPTSGT